MVGEDRVAGMALGGIGAGDENVPRGGDQKEDDGARDGGELADAGKDGACVAASESEMREDDEDGEDDADEALGEDVQGAAGGEGPAEERVWVGVWGDGLCCCICSPALRLQCSGRVWPTSFG